MEKDKQDIDHDLLITLNSKVDLILERYDEVDKIEQRVRDVEIKNGGYSESLDTAKKEIEKLRATNTVWSTVNTLLSLILAGIIALLNS